MQLTGDRPWFFRAPNGAMTQRQRWFYQNRGYLVVDLGFNTYDSHGKDSLVGQNLDKFWGKSLALVALMSSATTMATSTPRAHHTAHNE